MAIREEATRKNMVAATDSSRTSARPNAGRSSKHPREDRKDRQNPRRKAALEHGPQAIGVDRGGLGTRTPSDQCGEAAESGQGDSELRDGQEIVAVHSLPPTVRRLRGSAAPNSADGQRWGTALAAATLPRIDWVALFGVRSNALLGRALRTATRDSAGTAMIRDEKP